MIRPLDDIVSALNEEVPTTESLRDRLLELCEVLSARTERLSDEIRETGDRLADALRP